MPLSWNDIKSKAHAFSKTWATANQQISEHFGAYFARIPLKKSANIVNANALQTDWHSVCPNASFIVGNPPFIGKNYRNEQQDADMARVFTQAFINPIMSTEQQKENNQTIIYFDQFALIDKLKASGISAEQSEAIVRSIAVAQDGLVTKEFMKEFLDYKFSQELAPIKTEMSLLKWMITANTAILVALLLKSIIPN
jgi:hypothetical protein